MSEDKQRAHDFALKMMELYFQCNQEQFTKKTDSEVVLCTEKLFERYNQFFIVAMQEYLHSDEAV